MTDKPNLYVITAPPPQETPVQAVKRRVRNRPRPEHMMQCYECGGRELIETRLGMTRKNGKIGSGTKCLICAACWLKGERVVIT